MWIHMPWQSVALAVATLRSARSAQSDLRLLWPLGHQHPIIDKIPPPSQTLAGPSCTHAEKTKNVSISKRQSQKKVEQQGL